MTAYVAPPTTRSQDWPSYALQRNVVELPYRGVSVQRYRGEMTEKAISAHLIGREAYRRTNFIVLRGEADQVALAAIGCLKRDDLFEPIVHVEVLALPSSCKWVKSPETDCANPSALARLAERSGVGVNGTLVCEGTFDHVNFIHHPDPIVLRIVEVTPPEPPKLFSLVEHVLSYAILPPIKPVLESIELRKLAAERKPTSFLVPCRSGGLTELGAPVHYLDERPASREDWTLIGCERSLQFHRHYYGDEPPRIEMCPRAIAGKRPDLTLLKCCLLEFDIERDGRTMVIPWGADLAMVERALRELCHDLKSN